MSGKAMRVTMRFGKKDDDLILIATQYRLGDMLRLAIHNYLGLTKEKIPLPPNVPVKAIDCTTLYIKPEDTESIAFLEQFPPGQRSPAIKLLLRHATTNCDLRHLKKGPADNPKREMSSSSTAAAKLSERKPYETTKRDKPRFETILPSPSIELPRQISANEDNIFDLI